MNGILTRTLLAALLAAGLAGIAAAQYRWVDANGKVSYGDKPPSDARDVRPIGLKATPGSAGSDAMANFPFELRRAVERAPVILYTSPECQPCVPAAALLRERGVPYTERTVISPDDLQEFERISGGRRLPHVTVGAQAQNGFNADIWLSLLDTAGYPKGSMLPRSYQWPTPQPLVPSAKAETKPAAPTAGEQAATPAPARR